MSSSSDPESSASATADVTSPPPMLATRVRQQLTPYLPPPVVKAMRSVDPALEPFLGPEASTTLGGTLVMAWLVWTILSKLIGLSYSSTKAAAIQDDPEDDAIVDDGKVAYDGTVLLCGPPQAGKTSLFYPLVHPTSSSASSIPTISSIKPSTGYTAENNGSSTRTLRRCPLKQLMEQDWVGRAIVQYLDPADALSFSMASRATRVVCLGPPLEDIERSFREDCPGYLWGAAKIWQTLPNLRSQAIHTVFLKCIWRHQAWGNQKGMLSIVTHGGTAPGDFERPSDCVVSYREPAPDHTMPLVLSFRPDAKARQPYSIWVRVGGGGGHELFIDHFTVRVLTYTNGNQE